MTQQAPDITPLHQIMAQLRDPVGGCEWDVAQNFRSIAPYTIEEAYEVADAIERDDMAALKDELGDLLLQVVFHAQMADESGHFSLSDVISVICEKMMRRHPHIFAQEDRDASGQMVIRANWEAIKAQERAKKGEADSALSGVANALPALMRAEKLQKRAARVGFDWTEIEPVRAKIVEEMDELDAAPDEAARQEEAGDLLFAAVNLVRHYRIDPEVALRQGNAKFERRFRAMEALAGGAFASLSLDEQEALWQKVKEAQGS